MTDEELREACEMADIELSDEAADGSRLHETMAFLPGAGYVPLTAEPVDPLPAARSAAWWRAGPGSRTTP